MEGEGCDSFSQLSRVVHSLNTVCMLTTREGRLERKTEDRAGTGRQDTFK